MNATEKPEDHAEQNACGWLETIREHVACLEADRDRLEELRDEREAIDDPGDLVDWDSENREELDELTKAVTVEGEELDEDAIRERIQESPLSVQVRGGWHDPGAEDDGAEEFEILLSTGGPALRIVGDLDGHGQPSRARLEHQDWYKPWTEKVLDSDGYAALLTWCQQFYFGE